MTQRTTLDSPEDANLRDQQRREQPSADLEEADV